MNLPPQSTSKSFRFVHTADLHLGSRVTNLSRMGQSNHTDLTDATYGAWREVIDLCIRESADFLLVAGDVYDSADLNIRAQLQFVEGLKRLDEKGIPAYIVRGNHDPDDAWSNSITMPGNTFIFSSKEPEVVLHRDQYGNPIAAIVGMSFATARILDNLVERFPLRDGAWPYTIGLLHCSIGGIQGHEPYAPCSIRDLQRCGYDYWALGHIHRPTFLGSENLHIIYPGNPQGRNMGETDERGCNLVTVGPDGNATIERIKTCQYMWKEVEVDISGSEDLGLLEDDIRERMSALVKEAGMPIVGRLILTGATTLHRELTIKGGADALGDRLMEDPPGGRHTLLLERMVNRTVPFIDRSSVIEREDILGEICRQADRAMAQGDVRGALREDLDALFANSPSARQYLVQLDDDKLDDVIREAEALLLSYLSRSGSE